MTKTTAPSAVSSESLAALSTFSCRRMWEAAGLRLVSLEWPAVNAKGHETYWTGFRAFQQGEGGPVFVVMREWLYLSHSLWTFQETILPAQKNSDFDDPEAYLYGYRPGEYELDWDAISPEMQGRIKALDKAIEEALESYAIRESEMRYGA